MVNRTIGLRKITIAIGAAILLSGCGAVREKTAPCKRPPVLASWVEDPRSACGRTQPVNDPIAAFTAIGLSEKQGRR